MSAFDCSFGPVSDEHLAVLALTRHARAADPAATRK